MKERKKRRQETGLCGNNSPVSLPTAFYYVLKGPAQQSFVIYYLLVFSYLNSIIDSQLLKTVTFL